MKVSELVARLLAISVELGCDPEVFVGTYYRDHPIQEVVNEDGYPLIVCKEVTF